MNNVSFLNKELLNHDSKSNHKLQGLLNVTATIYMIRA